jgi:AcrR family transcriptional regulator
MEHTAQSSRGRPTRSPEQIAEMRAHIASCALSLFRADGYAGVSMRRLATEAGCTPMTLYQYYENKFEILGGLWSAVLGEVFDQLEALAAGESDPAERLRRVSEGYVEAWVGRRDDYYLVFMSGDVSQDDVTRFMGDDAVLARFDLFRSCIAEAVGPAASADELQVRAEVLVCSLNGIAQALVTMSGYPWPAVSTLVAGPVSVATLAD